MQQRLWLSPAETAPLIGAKDDQAVTRAIRLGQFPFDYQRMGRKILISARSLGLITDTQNEEAQNSATIATRNTACAIGD
jgi:hypothetical protein